LHQRSTKRANQLHELIRSLSKSEKRFFKIFSKRHVIGEQNKYVELFDAIESQSVYDEKEILDRFAEEKFVKRLAVAKGYLYELVLKSMNQYHSQNGLHQQVLRHIQTVAFLYEKNLLHQASRNLDKAYKLAEANEKISVMPELLYWHKKIMEAQLYSGKQIEDIEALYRREQEILNQIANLNEYWVLQAKLYYQHNLKGIIRNSEDLVKIEDMYRSSLMKREEQATTLRAKILYNKIYSTYFFILRDFESCYRYIRRMVELYELHPTFREAHTLEYVQSVNNLLNVTQVLKKPEETLEGLNRLKQMREQKSYRVKEKVELRLFESYFYHVLTFHLEKEDYVGGYQYVSEIEKGIERYRKNMDKMGTLMLRYHLFQICFGARKYEQSKNWIEKIISSKSSDIRQDILSFSHILRLMVLYEMGDLDELRGSIKETTQFLSKRKSTYQFESIVADYLQNLERIESKTGLVDSLIALRTQLKTLTEDPFERKAFAYFDFLGWLDKKIGKTSEIVVE